MKYKEINSLLVHWFINSLLNPDLQNSMSHIIFTVAIAQPAVPKKLSDGMRGVRGPNGLLLKYHGLCLDDAPVDV